MLGQADDLDPATDVRTPSSGTVPDHAWAADAARPGRAHRPARRARRCRRRRARRPRRADCPAASGAGSRSPRCWSRPDRRPAAARRADQPPRRRGRRLAGRATCGPLAAAGALVVVTHDRWFLDAVCERDLGGRRRRSSTRYDGGYAAYVLARAERARSRRVTEDRPANLLRKELAWLRRGPPARTSKPRFRHRRGQRADRRRAAAAGPARAGTARHGPARQGRVSTSRTSPCGSATADPARPT